MGKSANRDAGNHGIGEDDKLSCTRHQRHLVFLARRPQAPIRRFEQRVVKEGRRKRGSKKSRTHPLAATLEVTIAAATAAVIVIERKTDQGGDFGRG